MQRRKPENRRKIENAIKRLKRQGYTGRNPLKDERQELFCQEYLVDLNRSKAAVRAGYSEHAKHDIAYELMGNPKILIRIEYLKMERQKKLRFDQESVIKELQKVAFSNILDFVEVTKDGIKFKEDMNFDPVLYDKAGAVQELTSEKGKKTKIGIKLYDKIQALDKLMKHLDLYERARLQIEQEKLELLKIKNNPE